jgi:adenine-specific DNA-methyltransferase
MQLTTEAYEAGLVATRDIGREEQKRLGQFITPPAIARLMATRALGAWSGEVLRILEPAAGSGVLAAAAIEAALGVPHRPARIELSLCEIDDRLLPRLHDLRARLATACAAAGIDFDCKVQHADFLLSELALSRAPAADVVIANPPYFKLSGSDPRARMHDYAVHGQPNIYGLFMAACANLLLPGGRYCFITPRSWMNGAYFSATRQHLLRRLRFDAFHTFDSRTDHFCDDEVLQEAVIAWATAGPASPGDVLISTSRGGHDLQATRAASSHPMPRARSCCRPTDERVRSCSTDPPWRAMD